MEKILVGIILMMILQAHGCGKLGGQDDVIKNQTTRYKENATQRINEGASSTAKDDSIFVAYTLSKWNSRTIPVDILLKGDKEEIDTGFGDVFCLVGGEMAPWSLLGSGQKVIGYDGVFSAHFYKDNELVRMIAVEGPHFSCDTLILSRISQHPAETVGVDLSSLKTNNGLGLGVPRDVIIDKLGTPSLEDGFGEYGILIYFGIPKRTIPLAVGHAAYKSGYYSGYAILNGEVVEIILHSWTTERSG